MGLPITIWSKKKSTKLNIFLQMAPVNNLFARKVKGSSNSLSEQQRSLWKEEIKKIQKKIQLVLEEEGQEYLMRDMPMDDLVVQMVMYTPDLPVETNSNRAFASVCLHALLCGNNILESESKYSRLKAVFDGNEDEVDNSDPRESEQMPQIEGPPQGFSDVEDSDEEHNETACKKLPKKKAFNKDKEKLQKGSKPKSTAASMQTQKTQQEPEKEKGANSKSSRVSQESVVGNEEHENEKRPSEKRKSRSTQHGDYSYGGKKRKGSKEQNDSQVQQEE